MHYSLASTTVTIRESFDNIKEIKDRATGKDQSLKDFSDIRAFSKATAI